MVKYSLPLFLNTFWTFAPWLFDVVRKRVRRAPQRFANLNYDGKPILQTLPVSQLLGRRSIFGSVVYRVRARRTTWAAWTTVRRMHTHHALGAVRKDPQGVLTNELCKIGWEPVKLEPDSQDPESHFE